MRDYYYDRSMHSSLKWTILDLITNCNNIKSFKQIHAHLLTTALLYDHSVSGAVVDYLGNYLAALDYACNYLRCLDSHRSGSYPFNALLSRYSAGNVPGSAFYAYRNLVRHGFIPDTFTFPPLLKSCSKRLVVGEGAQLLGVIVRMGYSSDVYVLNSLVYFYTTCGDCGSARRLFDKMPVRDAVTWSCLISGYAKNGLFGEALGSFLSMDVEPNASCFVSALAGCGHIGYLNLGKCIHGAVLKRGTVEKRGPVLVNALMDMYVKCERLSEARRVFDEAPERDVISWSSIISGLAQSQHPQESLELLDRMQRSGGAIEPDEVVLTSVLSAIASLGALDRGKWVHEYIDRKGVIRDVHVGTAMIDMYAKCGSIEMALKIFEEMTYRNVVTWNALLGGLAIHGRGLEAIEKFEEMTRTGTRPNEITFLALLTSCCHSGLVEEGRKYFRQMVEKPHNISPRLEHYGCMVDLLCKARLVDEALNLVATMPMTADVSIFGALLSACNAAGDIDLSREISDQLIEIESRDSGAFVLVSNTYASSQRWSDVTRLRGIMKKKGIRKEPGSSFVEVDGIHEFLVGDTSHPRSEEIYQLLTSLTNQG